MLATKNLKFQFAHVNAEKGDSEFNLTGNTALFKSAQVQINDTLVALPGQVATPVEPNIQLLVTSPDLNLDRLMPQDGADASGDKPSQAEGGHAPEKTVKGGWPPVAFKTTAHIQVDADAGRYKGTKFQKLKLDATYD